MENKKFDHAVPFLAVRDLQETINYYRNQLGFYNEWLWKKSDAGMERDNLHVLFNLDPEYVTRINTEKRSFEIMWFVTGVEEIYEEYKSKSVNIIRELREEPWGAKEFCIEDINGYVIRIAKGMESNNK